MLSFPRTFPVLPAKDFTGNEQIDWPAGHHPELRYYRRVGKNRFFAACQTIREVGASRASQRAGFRVNQRYLPECVFFQ